MDTQHKKDAADYRTLWPESEELRVFHANPKNCAIDPYLRNSTRKPLTFSQLWIFTGLKGVGRNESQVRGKREREAIKLFNCVKIRK